MPCAYSLQSISSNNSCAAKNFITMINTKLLVFHVCIRLSEAELQNSFERGMTPADQLMQPCVFFCTFVTSDEIKV
jgi:hypothetical protein